MKAGWLGWRLTLGVPNMRNVVLSPKRIQSIFTEGLACVYITESFSYMLLFWPILSLGCQSQPSAKGGETEGRCVSSPWCSPVFRLTERNCKETCLHKHKAKNYLDYFLLKDPFLCWWTECFRSRTPGFVLGFRMPPCQCRPGFII